MPAAPLFAPFSLPGRALGVLFTFMLWWRLFCSSSSLLSASTHAMKGLTETENRASVAVVHSCTWRDASRWAPKSKKTTRLTQIFTDKCSVGLRWSIHYRIAWPKQLRKQDIILAFLIKNKTFHSQLRIWILLTDCYAFLSRSRMRTWYDHAISPAWINLVIEWIG